MLDLHMGLTLRNSGQSRIRGVTMLVSAQEVTPGGRASVSVPSLDAGPGETFPLRIDLRLLRPLQAGGGPLVRVELDGVLFHDFSFYGPNRLDSRRSMMVWEKEAQRDRQFFKSVLQAYGTAGLQRVMLDSIEREAARPRMDVQVARRARSTSTAAAGRPVQFAFLQFAGSPIEPLTGGAVLSGNEARAPRIEVRNRSDRPVRHFEIGWIVKDRQGKSYWAASVPGSEAGSIVAAGSTASALQDTALRFAHSGSPAEIEAMVGFVSQVEFADGSIWIPDRAALENNQLLRLLAPSPEEQRLTDLYNKKGITAILAELKKF